jgi:hypothetical protein
MVEMENEKEFLPAWVLNDNLKSKSLVCAVTSVAN